MKVITDTNGKVIMTSGGAFEAPSATVVTHPAPTISVNSSTGLITASHTQSSGEVEGGTTTATQQLTVQAAQTITPTTTNQTIASGKYLTGTQTILGDANLVAANIASGVTIFGVTGSHSGGGGGTAVAVTITEVAANSYVYYITPNGTCSQATSGGTVQISCLLNSLIVYFVFGPLSPEHTVTNATLINSVSMGSRAAFTYVIIYQVNSPSQQL